MSVFPGPGTDSQPGEISTHPQTGDRVPGIPCELSLLPLSLPTREDEEDPARCLNPHTTPICLNKRPGQVSGEGISLGKGHLVSPLVLQGPTNYDKFCERGRPLPGEQSIQVQYQPPAHYTSHEGLALVDSPGQRLPGGLNPVTSNPRLDNRVRCFQHRLGSSSRGDSDRGPVVKDRVLKPYQPSRAASSFLGSPMFHEGEVQHYYTTEVGQCPT